MAMGLPCDAESYWQPSAARLMKITSSAKRRMRYRRSSIICAQKHAVSIKSIVCQGTAQAQQYKMRAEAIEFVPQVDIVLSSLMEKSHLDNSNWQCSVPVRRELRDTCQAEHLPVIQVGSTAEISIDICEVDEIPPESEVDILDSSMGCGHITNSISKNIRERRSISCMGHGRGSHRQGTLGKGYGGLAGDSQNMEHVTTWPIAGETWIFNGKLQGVPVYDDAHRKSRGSFLGCTDGNTRTDFREVLIMDVSCSEFVKIQGTSNMGWLRGWIKATDAGGDLIFDRLKSKDGEFDHG